VRKTTTSLVVVPAAFLLALVAPGAASAAETYQVELGSLNDTGAEGQAILTVRDDGSLRVQVEASGLVPNLPHAQHLHGDETGTTDYGCPGPERDSDGDGVVGLLESSPAYGGVYVSLTTTGDASEDSGLALERMPVADGEGNLRYDRTFAPEELPAGTAQFIRNHHVAHHGVDVNGNGEYDAGAGTSEIVPGLPVETEAPATCGAVLGSTVSALPEGGVATGGGAAEGPPAGALAALGGAALAGALALTAYRRRV
jgi:hypothetical protein